MPTLPSDAQATRFGLRSTSIAINSLSLSGFGAGSVQLHRVQAKDSRVEMSPDTA